MSQSASADQGHAQEPALRLRDWVVMPLIGLLTIAVLAGTTELAARRLFRRSVTTGEDCMMSKDTLAGGGGIPNSVCWEQVAEGGLVEYRFNGSGYRSDVEFGPKQPGVYRILIIGSSVSAGARVPIEQAFATELPVEIEQRTGLKAEVYNMALAGDGSRLPVVAKRFDAALAAKPDLILWVMSSLDFARIVQPATAGGDSHTNAPAKEPPLRAIADLPHKMLKSTAGIMLQHLLYQSQSEYVGSYLRQGDAVNGYLKSSFSAQWNTNLAEFDNYFAAIEQRVKTGNVPLVVTLAPLRAQAAMISMGSWPAGYDPYKLDSAVQAIVENRGATFVDIMPEFRRVPNPERYYYAVDGHPDAEGHRILAGMLTAKLTSGAVPTLDASKQNPASNANGGR